MSDASASWAADPPARALAASTRGVPALVVGLGCCLLLGAATLLVRSTTLGYDPYSWMVWARQLLDLQLDTTRGPSWKPLPALLAAPLTPFGDLAPHTWMWLMRSAAFAALLFAYRTVVRLGGTPWGGVVAVVGLAVSVDLFSASLRGYSEPLLIALVLAACEAGVARRWRTALALLALGGLLRPELWLLSVGVGLYAVLRPGAARTARSLLGVGTLMVTAPAIWFVLDLVGSGNALEASTVARTAPPGSAALTSSPTLTVLGRAVDAVPWPTLALAALALAAAARRRRGAVLVLAGLAVAWIAEIALFAELGYTGRRRYLLVAAAVICVLSGVGMSELMQRAGRWRTAAVVAVAVLLAVGAVGPLRHNARLSSHGPDFRAQHRDMVAAVAAAGGPSAVARRGGAVVNSYLQSAMAWTLGVGMADVDKPSGYKRRRLGYAPPAVLFRAPERLAGPRPEIPAGATARPIGRVGRWRVTWVQDLGRTRP